jgi:hypothetical protein
MIVRLLLDQRRDRSDRLGDRAAGHHLIGDPVGFLFVAVARAADRELGLERGRRGFVSRSFSLQGLDHGLLARCRTRRVRSAPGSGGTPTGLPLPSVHRFTLPVADTTPESRSRLPSGDKRSGRRPDVRLQDYGHDRGASARRTTPCVIGVFRPTIKP